MYKYTIERIQMDKERKYEINEKEVDGMVYEYNTVTSTARRFDGLVID